MIITPLLTANNKQANGGLRHVEFSSICRSANGVAHSLARYAKHLGEDFVWLEDSPPPTLEALYLDSISN